MDMHTASSTLAWNLPRRRFMASTGGAILGWMSGLVRGEEPQLAALIDEAPQSHVLIPALRMALSARDAILAVADYEAIFHKTELVGRKTNTSRMQVKLRHAPFSVYVKYLEPHAGREAIYVSGSYDHKVIVHDTGLASLAGTLKLDPQGSTAMDGNRYPITRVGMQHLVSAVIDQWLALAKSNASGVTVNHYPNAKIGEVSCSTIETVLSQSNTPGAFQTTRLYIDAATRFPIRVQQYLFPSRRGQKPVLAEDYLYQQIKTDIGLAQIDFDPSHPQYGY